MDRQVLWRSESAQVTQEIPWSQWWHTQNHCYYKVKTWKFNHWWQHIPLHSVCLIRVLGVKVSFLREDWSDPSSGEWCIISMKKSLIWTFAYYSCKAYDSRRQLSPETLAEILEAGRMAPTANNLQEQHIYVCQSPEALAKIGACTPCRYGAPHD